MSAKYVSSARAVEKMGVHANTLRRWEREGKLVAIRTPGGRRLYNVDEFEERCKQFPQEKVSEEIATTETEKGVKARRNVIYTRVSGAKQKEDLKRQSDTLLQFYPGYEVLSDIGSGLNFKRKEFRRLLRSIMHGEVGCVVVAFRDRMCRFAIELIEFICREHQTQFLVHFKDKESSSEEELMEDLMAVVHVFSSRLYGKRGRKQRKPNSEVGNERVVPETTPASTKMSKVVPLSPVVKTYLKTCVDERERMICTFDANKRSKTQQKQLDDIDEMRSYMSCTPSEYIDFHGLEMEQDDIIQKIGVKTADLDPHFVRSKRVRIYIKSDLTKEAVKKMKTAAEKRAFLNNGITDTRRVFNECVALQREGSVSLDDIRNQVIRGDKVDESMRKTLRTPEHVRQKAFDKFSSSSKSCITHEGHLKFMSKSDKGFVGFQKRDVKFISTHMVSIHGYTYELGEGVGIPDTNALCDVEITKERGRYFISIPDIIPQVVKVSGDRVCALDMGERTFASLYSPDGDIAALGTDVQGVLKRKLRQKWKQSMALKNCDDKEQSRKIYKAWCRTSRRVAGIVKDLHNRVASYLVDNYDTIIIGKLSQGVMKSKRKGKRVISSLQHYRFRQRLLQKANVTGKHVHVNSEWMSTKQCNHCGYIWWKVGSSEVFKCKNCKIVLPRDIHSARGIFVKNTR
jgi:predicted site-specific integrase-resolvase/transposase